MRRPTRIRRRFDRAAPLLVLLLLAPDASFAHVAIEEQIEALTLRIAASPADAVLYLRRGELRRAHAEWRGARRDYRRARRLDPELEAVDLCLAHLRVDEGRPARALPPLDRFLAARPDHAAARLLRGRVLAALGRQQEASADLARGIAAFVPPLSAQPDDYLALARSLAAAGRDGSGEAVARLDEGMRVLGPIVTLQLAAIDLDVAAGRFDAALLRVEEASATSHGRIPWLAKRASILEAAGRHDEALVAHAGTLLLIEALPPGDRRAAAVREIESAARTALAAAPAERPGAPGEAGR